MTIKTRARFGKPMEDMKGEALKLLQIAAQRQGISKELSQAWAEQAMAEQSPENALLITSALVMQRREAESDPLTGLKNRQWLFRNHKFKRIKSIKGRWVRVPNDGKQFFLDLDDFGRINKKYGEMEGDEVLVVFSRLLKKHFSAIADCVRMGGEEFSILAHPNVLTRDLLLADKRLRWDFDRKEFISGRVTYSGGVGDTYLEAERRLRAAKCAGKNRTCY